MAHDGEDEEDDERDIGDGRHPLAPEGFGAAMGGAQAPHPFERRGHV